MRIRKANVSSDDLFDKRIATNLRILLNSKPINLSNLSYKLGIPAMTIRRLLSGQTTDPRLSTLKLIADYFEVSLDELTKKDANTFLKKSGSSLCVPILSWDTIEKIKNFDNLDLSQCENWQTIYVSQKISISKNSFALKSRPSMYPRYPQGTLFVINPDLAPTDGDIVLIKIKDNHEITLRELSIDPPEWLLNSLIETSHSVLLNKSKHKIIGVNMLTIMYNQNIFNE